MAHMEMNRHSGFKGMILSVLLLVFVTLLVVLSIILVRIKLLQNAQDMGMALAQSYAMEEENTLRTLEINLVMAGQYVNEIVANGGSTLDIQNWLAGCFSKLTDIIGEGMVDFYAVIDGRIVAANPWEGDDSFDFSASEWYLQAIEAGGQPAWSDAYQDAITQERIFTISQELERAGDVLAMNVYIQSEALHSTTLNMPDQYSYYLCDQHGQLLYAVTNWNKSISDLQGYADYCMEGIADGSLLPYDASFKDLNGIERGMYYHQMENGWTAILTIPMSTILLGERNTTIYLIAAVASILYVAMFILIIQAVLRNRKMLVADQTIHMLGDSYYAIFRVNFREGRYFAIKNQFSGDILPPAGDYDLLLHAVSEGVCSSTYQAFETSFSLENIRQLIHKGIVDHGGDYQRHFGDTYRWVSVRMLYNQALSPDVVILCFRDVDQEKRRELQHTLLLQEALDAAQKSTKSRTEFFSRMSHDMRTPLNAVIGCCDLAKRSCDGNDIDKAKDYLKKIAFAGNQLLGLINEILELSRVESGKSSLEYRELNLRSLLVDLVEIFKDQANEENKEVEINIDFQNDIVIGDEKKIIQIVNNLLSNAVKYTNPGGRIRLEARQFVFQRQSKYQILVEDTGIGMTQAFLEHLFDPYSRETAFTPHPVTGTGLGMPIVRNLVHQMSGEISVESELGLGSRFTVTLPFATVKTKETVERVDPEKGSVESFCWNGRRILVADDNELNREIIATVINQFGAEVLQAEDGQEAVDIFQKEPIYSIDAVLMDMQMPKLDGCQAAAAIRRLGREDSDTVPIIAVTANAFAEDVNRSTAAGMNAHVSKPINSVQLRKTMENLIAEREIQLKQRV